MRVLRCTVAALLVAVASSSQIFEHRRAQTFADAATQVVSLFGDFAPAVGNNKAVQTGVNAIRNGATIGPQLQQCYDSVQGNSGAIDTAYNAIQNSIAADGGLQTYSNAVSAFNFILQAYSGDATMSSTLSKLLTIWLNEQANSGSALSPAEQAAYNVLTPPCDQAFSTLVSSVDEGRAVVSSLMAGTGNYTCSNFKNNATAGRIDVTLCSATSNATVSNGGVYYNITAYLTNYGDPLCNVTFFINNLDQALNYTPSWLPFASKGYPSGIPTGESINIFARVPYEVDLSHTLPQVDVLDNFYVCPKVIQIGTPQATPAPTKSDQEKLQEVQASKQACFLTDKCAKAVAPFADDQCSALQEIFSSGCHTCAADVVADAQAQCRTQCPASKCVAKPKKEQISGAMASKASAVVVALAMAFAAFFTSM